ncbi:MAG: hypothetical protein O3A10_10165 [Chloroflexi bacterium]|nr:hypothetical protein [Chloroflexota bacterium]MDA1146506.1 hypothetical protein [Chloroflexota bacterium]
MPRLPELSKEDADPAVRDMMEAHEGFFGLVLNPLKLQGYVPSIARGASGLGRGIDEGGNIEAQLRYLVYSFVAGRNGCPF